MILKKSWGRGPGPPGLPWICYCALLQFNQIWWWYQNAAVCSSYCNALSNCKIKGQITSSVIHLLPRKNMLLLIRKIKPVSILWMGPKYFFLDNQPKMPGVIPALGPGHTECVCICIASALHPHNGVACYHLSSMVVQCLSWIHTRKICCGQMQKEMRTWMHCHDVLSVACPLPTHIYTWCTQVGPALNPHLYNPNCGFLFKSLLTSPVSKLLFYLSNLKLCQFKRT